MDLARYTNLLKGAGKSINELSRDELIQLIELIEEMEKRDEVAGLHNWLVPGTPFGIDKLHKHRAAFDATSKYRETLFMGGNRCKVAGTKVWMADGSEKNIEDVEIGEKVLAFDVRSNNLVESTVVDTYAGVSDDVWWFNSDRNDTGFGATLDHEVLVKPPNQLPRKKALGDRRYYDNVVVPCSWEKSGVAPWFSENVARLLGLLVGDGHLCARNSAYKLTNTNEDILAFAEKTAAEMGLKTRRVHYKNCVDLHFAKPQGGRNQSALGELLERVGLKGSRSGNKFVPECILNAPVSYVKAFIQGLLAADGSYSKGRIDLWTTSEHLAKTYQMALLRIGVTSSYSSKKHKNPNHADCYRVTVSGDHYTTKVGDSFHKKVVLADTKKVPATYRSRTLQKSHKLPKQEVYCITVDHPDHLFVANGFVTSNCGKTREGAMLAAVLATGLYPDWWTGARFDGPVEIWAVGMSAQTTRDTCQKELIGPVDALGTGLIPKECIGKLAKMSKPADAVESVRIKHVSGKWSTIGFKSYEQSAESFYGTAKHLIWLDEPCPDLVYHESVMRTASTGGKIFHTITPKKGLTRMLADFLAECDLLAGTEALPGLDVARALSDAALSDDELLERAEAKRKSPKPSRCAIAVGWDDAPWLDEQTRNDLLAATPPYLRDTVSRGVPSLGHSAVYPVPLDSVLCKPEEMIEIPAHWKRVYGMDVASKTAAVFLALDPDNDIAYVVGEYYGENQPKEVHAARIKHIAGDWMPGVVDPASRQRQQTDGQKLFDDYTRLGLKLRKADNQLTAGLHEVWSRLSQGRLRFWPNTPNLQREYVMYRYDENPSNPKPVKVHDHVMDALRYAVMGLQHAKPKQISSHLNFNFPKGRRYNV